MRSLVALLLACGCNGPSAVAPDADPATDGLQPGAVASLGTGDQADVLSAADGTLIAVFDAPNGAQRDLYLRTSVDGVNWTAATMIVSSPDLDDVHPTLLQVDGRYLLTWMRVELNGPFQVWYASSDDLATWDTQVVAADSTDDWAPSLVATSSGLEIVFASETRGTGGEWDLYAVTSADGTTWSAPVALSVNDATMHDMEPALLGTGATLSLVWQRCAPTYQYDCSHGDTMAATSSDGLVWSTPVTVTTDIQIGDIPSLYARDDGTAMLAWIAPAGANTIEDVTMPLAGPPALQTALPFEGWTPRITRTRTAGVYLGTYQQYDIEYTMLFAQ
jgi:hypothetical protein